MATLTPVDNDPFAAAPATATTGAPTLTPVDHDPFAAAPQPSTVAQSTAALGPLRGAEDMARLIANGATFGLADKAASLFGGDPAAEAAETKEAAARTGKLGTAASIGGTLLPALAGGSVVSAGADALAGVPALGRVAGNTLVQGSATGAGLGAADAAAHGQPIGAGAATGAAAGAGGAVLGSVVSRGVGALGDMFATRPAAPTSEALQQQAQDAYRAAENAGVVYSPAAVDRLRGAVQSNMADFGYAPELQPGGAAVLRSLDRSDGVPTTLAGIDTTRKIAGNMYTPTSPSSGALGGRIKGVIDDFTANPRPGDIMMGDANGGVQALTDARRLYNMSSKDQDLADALDAAQRQAGKAGSGGNINNATRTRLNSLLDSRQDWTPDEEAALRSAIVGTPASNAMRLAGKFSPEGNGLIQLLELGGAGAALHAGQPSALALPLAGFVAKRAADRMTGNAAANLGELIRSGGVAASPNVVQQFALRARQPVADLTLGSLYAEPSQ